MAQFKDKNICIIGSSSGIGLALLKQLISESPNLYSVSRRNSPADSKTIQHLNFDVTKDPLSAFQAFLPDQLSGLVYCPGSITLKPFHRLKLADFQKDLEVNLFGAFKMIQTALPALKRSESASVVLFSTVATRIGMSFHASIAAAKAALEGLAISLAAELASANIRVNVIAPSLTHTPLAEHLLSSEAKIQASANRHPLKKIGQADEIAATAAHLLSSASNWISGQIIAVDGGLSTLKPL